MFVRTRNAYSKVPLAFENRYVCGCERVYLHGAISFRSGDKKRRKKEGESPRNLNSYLRNVVRF